MKKSLKQIIASKDFEVINNTYKLKGNGIIYRMEWVQSAKILSLFPLIKCEKK